MSQRKIVLTPPKELFPIFFLFLGIFLFVSLLSFSSEEGSVSNWFGRVGHYTAMSLNYLFGKASYSWGALFLLLGIFTYKSGTESIQEILISILTIPILLSWSFGLVEQGAIESIPLGGGLGSFIVWVTQFLLGNTGSLIFNGITYCYVGFSIWKKISKSGIAIPRIDFGVFANQVSKIDFSKLSPKFSSKIDLGFLKNTFSREEFSNLSREPEDLYSRMEFLETRPRMRKFKKESVLEGFFTESDTVFRFATTKPSLVQKLSTTSSLGDLQFSILDLRNQKPKEDPLFSEQESAFDHSTLKPIQYSQEANLENSDAFTDEESLHAGTLREEGFASEDLDDPSALEDFSSSESSGKSLGAEIVPFETISIDDAAKKEVQDSAPQYPLFPEIAPKPKEVAPKTFRLETHVPEIRKRKSNYYISQKLLRPISPAKSFFQSGQDEEKVSQKIVEILSHYGIEASVVYKEKGPIITRYEINVPNGLKLNKVTSLVDEFKLYLAVKSIRIVAPIPGKSTVGLEVPNIKRDDVFLSDILKDTLLKKDQKDLTLCIGKDISGKNVFVNLASLPHLLVAGTTGSGKSVALNSMIVSLLYSRSPEELRFIMIDPKMVELSLYSDIPHLLMPVITDPRVAVKALSWAIQEMEARYQSVSGLKVRDLKSYNEKVEEAYYKNKGYKKLPYILIFIDELSDLMMVSGKELEEQIVRITQKARAVGIHLVMATQRPSVDVITGLIKANCPARIAFHVAQKTDSRTILDTNGAEALLGRGDFLYRSPTSQDPQRIQAPYLDEKEIERVVDEVKSYGEPNYIVLPTSEDSAVEDLNEEDEELFEEAWRIVLRDKRPTTSYIQREMRIGYNKAARIIDLMERRGYIGPSDHAGRREILKAS